MVLRRIQSSIRNADYGALLLEMLVLVAGVLLALAADRWNQDRVDAIETARIVARLKSDTARNLAMFDESMPRMEGVLRDIKALHLALQSGSTAAADPAQIARAITNIGVVPSYPLVFAAYDELVATGRLRQLADPVLVDLLGRQRAEYDAAQRVVGYWRDIILASRDAFDRHVDYFYTTDQMDEEGMGVRFDLASLAADRRVKNRVFEAVDVHGDWLRHQAGIRETTRQIAAQLGVEPASTAHLRRPAS
jgi:hypothetical protein